MRLRPATRADAEGCLAIYGPVVERTAISFEEAVPSADAFADRIDAAIRWLVAEADGRIAGYAYASPHRSRAAYRWSVEVSAYVHPDFRRRGVAGALYRELLDGLVEAGFCSAYAGITLPNPGSVALHEAMGFTPVGVFGRVGFKHGRWHDVGWWQRTLREGPPMR